MIIRNTMMALSAATLAFAPIAVQARSSDSALPVVAERSVADSDEDGIKGVALPVFLLGIAALIVGIVLLTDGDDDEDNDPISV